MNKKFSTPKVVEILLGSIYKYGKKVIASVRKTVIIIHILNQTLQRRFPIRIASFFFVTGKIS